MTPQHELESFAGSGSIAWRPLVPLSAVMLLAMLASLSAATIENGQITSSVVCGTCHRDIYRMWRSSAHASAVESVVFLDALRDRERQDPGVTRLCLGCHAPFAELGGDLALKQQVTWEGVSCDACHSLTSVDLKPGGVTQVFAPGPVKRGPIRDAVSTGHEVAYSPLHTSALVCAGCHEFRNAEGTPIITTYSEWQDSSAGRRGTTCQSCHMGLTGADVVDPKVKRVAMSEVNLHEMPGGHSPAQLNKGLSISESTVRQGDDLTLEVRLTNKGAGHAIPTGMPGRRLILFVGVRTSDGKAFEEKRTYSKTFLDAGGQTIAGDGGVFTPGVRLATDSRIKPDEQRKETFHFPVPATATVTVNLKLHYEHVPGGAPENRTWITFYTQDRVYPPEGR